jgi:tetraacyldisaccharide-1-P 4'-kinase
MSCALGNPGAFMKTLKEQGIEVQKKFIFPDHYFWKPLDIEKITYHMKQENSSHLMITEKDAVKLVRYKKHFFEMGIQLWVCKMKVQLREDEDKLFQIIDEVISL